MLGENASRFLESCGEANCGGRTCRIWERVRLSDRKDMSKPDRWWVRELISVCDPISLDPIRTLRHPPFELRADPAAAHNSPDSDWYDGQLLASYLVSTGNFTHPMSRRELTRAECAALYCQKGWHEYEG